MPIKHRATLQILGLVLAAVSLAAVGWFAYLGLKSGVNLADAELLPFAGAVLVQLLVLVLSSLLWGRLLDVFCVPSDLRRVAGRGRGYARSCLARLQGLGGPGLFP